MRAARTDKFVFQVKLNPSLSVEMRPFVLNSHSIGSNAYRRQRRKKEQDIRTKRPARSGRDKSDSSPGSPCCLRVSQLSERASFRCVRRTNLQRSGVRSGRQDLSAVFSVPSHPPGRRGGSRPGLSPSGTHPLAESLLRNPAQ